MVILPTWIVFELWAEGSDVHSCRIDLFSKRDGTEVLHGAVDERRAAALHPATAGDGHLKV